jgi:ceramide glucosyltransferase
VLLNGVLGLLAGSSLGLLLWQWVVALRFPLHQRITVPSFFPPVTLLKPLKGCDETMAECLKSWLAQEYPGPVQILFGVARAEDPVCVVVEQLLRKYPGCDARLVVCGTLRGANLKVAKLVQLEQLARHELVILSDADVCVPPDLLAQVVAPLQDPAVGLVNCFYRLANPTTPAMEWEAVAINADFWSQVLQAQSLKPLDFALGAVMATRRQQLKEIGGLEALADCLADDYQLGHRIAQRGHRVVLSPVTVECWSAPMGWSAVWKHQLRWARTIRVCQPGPYFLSILSNATLWPLIALAANPTRAMAVFAAVCWLVRMAAAAHLQARLALAPWRAVPSQLGTKLGSAPLALIKDLLQAAIWLLAFTGNRVEWRGETMRLRRDGTLVRN